MGGLISYVLLDEEKIEGLFRYFGSLKTSMAQAELEYEIARANWLSKVYNTPDSEMKKLFQEANDCYKERSFFKKISDLIFTQLCDLREDVKKEIKYRKDNTRKPDDWKENFMSIVSCFEHTLNGKWKEGVTEYVMDELIPNYQKRLDKK